MTRNIKAWDMEFFVSDVLAAIAADKNASGSRSNEAAEASASST
jgi:hypothetical protein